MSKEEDRLKHSKRLHRVWTAIKRQLKIAKSHGMTNKVIEEPHRLAKHHAMDCGVPNCPMCSNPRHNKATKDHLTIQEKRNNQKANDE
jgi:hypothetical protein